MFRKGDHVLVHTYSIDGSYVEPGVMALNAHSDNPLASLMVRIRNGQPELVARRRIFTKLESSDDPEESSTT
jgi:hypothetical protein